MPELPESLPASPLTTPPWLRTGHGNGAGVPRIEVPPADELKAGIPALPETRRAAARTADGRLVPGAATSEQSRRAAAARWARQRESVRVLEHLGLRGIAPEAIQPYLKDAEEFTKHEVERLAREVGGGDCGAAACAMVQNASLQM